MEKYEVLGIVGEGSYGQVMKCRHKESGELVAIKKFIETEEDLSARKMALREIRMLKRLQHDNLVNMLEVFRRNKRFHLVFEFMTSTLLDRIEKDGGLSEDKTRQFAFQMIRGLDFCHVNNIVHRDLKPENVLVSEHEVIKLCDFGFARFITISQDPFTEYVATRWYRAPELLVGDIKYGRAVDIWALGCMIIEMLSGSPLFPGVSDVDQLYKITSILGNLTSRQMECLKSRMDSGRLLPDQREYFSIEQLHQDDEEVAKGFLGIQALYPDIERRTLNIASLCLKIDPTERPKSYELFNHVYFMWDNFPKRFMFELLRKLELDQEKRPRVLKVPCTPTLEQQGMLANSVSCPRHTDWKLDVLHPHGETGYEPTTRDSDMKSSLVTLIAEEESKLDIQESETLESVVEPTQSNLAASSVAVVPSKSESLLMPKEQSIPDLLKAGKITARFNKTKMPKTLRIVPTTDGKLAIFSPNKMQGLLQKPTARDFCLPDLPGMGPKKRKYETRNMALGTPRNCNELSCVCLTLPTRKYSYCPICSPSAVLRKER